MRGPMDNPKSLKNMAEREDRLKKRFESRVAKLNNFVEQVRQETGKGCQIPYFDPEDGGVEARCLFLFEAPGPNAVDTDPHKGSGFISRDNDDQTAKNFNCLNKKAGLDRQQTVLWNIVPWYISKKPGKKIPKKDIVKGTECLEQLLCLPELRHLQIIVLAGNTAKRVEGFLRVKFDSIDIVMMPHPSPQFVNRESDKNKKWILAVLKQVVRSLKNIGADS